MTNQSKRIRGNIRGKYKQFGIVDDGTRKTLMDAEECSAYIDYLDGIPIEEIHLPREDDPYYLIYGVLLNDLKGKEKTEPSSFQAEKNIFSPHATICGGEVYISWYPEILLAQPMIGGNKIMPAALLLKTSLPVESVRYAGFGYTLFSVSDGYADVLGDLIGRDYILCVRDIEEKYDEYDEDWISSVDIERMIRVAGELFPMEGGEMIEKRGYYA